MRSEGLSHRAFCVDGLSSDYCERLIDSRQVTQSFLFIRNHPEDDF